MSICSNSHDTARLHCTCVVQILSQCWLVGLLHRPPPPLFSALRLQSTDLSEYADLRSFVLQQSRHFVLKRLRGTPSSITTRYYVSIYNNQHSKLEQPAQVGRFPVCSHQGTTSACISALMLLC